MPERIPHPRHKAVEDAVWFYTPFSLPRGGPCEFPKDEKRKLAAYKYCDKFEWNVLGVYCMDWCRTNSANISTAAINMVGTTFWPILFYCIRSLEYL